MVRFSLAILLFLAIPLPAAADGDLAARLLALVNAERTARGLGEVAMDARLAAAARAHSGDMAERDFFAHQGPDGSGLGARLAGAGYRWRMMAENIAAGEATPEATVAGWMESDGHRHNILTAGFVDAGIGYAFRQHDGGTVRYRHYWTLILGRKVPSKSD